MSDAALSEIESCELDVLTAAHGAGPLLQRDYWAPLWGTVFMPGGIMRLVASKFPSLADPKIATFSFVQPPPLEIGHEMQIEIRGYGSCHVRVVEHGLLTLTLRTLEDHFEAGRITFGSWREEGELLFKIRSRARIRSKPHSWGWAAGGWKAQEQLWKHFVKNLAAECGAAEPDEVHEETCEVQATLADLGELDTPTFLPK